MKNILKLIVLNFALWQNVKATEANYSSFQIADFLEEVRTTIVALHKCQKIDGDNMSFFNTSNCTYEVTEHEEQNSGSILLIRSMCRFYSTLITKWEETEHPEWMTKRLKELHESWKTALRDEL